MTQEVVPKHIMSSLDHEEMVIERPKLVIVLHNKEK